MSISGLDSVFRSGLGLLFNQFSCIGIKYMGVFFVWQRNSDNAALIAVDGNCFIDRIAAGKLAVVEMNVTVKEKQWTVAFDQFVEALKAGVTPVFAIVVTECRSVGDQNVEAAALEEGKPQLANPLFHLFFGVLPGTVVIPHRSAKA